MKGSKRYFTIAFYAHTHIYIYCNMRHFKCEWKMLDNQIWDITREERQKKNRKAKTRQTGFDEV